MERQLTYPRRQHGLILLIALVVLSAMSLAAIALIRNVDTAVLLAANLAFRQSATMAGDTGIRAGTNWLSSKSGSDELYSDQLSSTSAYWSNAQNAAPAFDPLSYGWSTTNNAVCTADDGAGNQVCWVIHRLCDLAGNPLGVKCVRPPATSGSTNNSSKAVVSAGSMPMSSTASAYYRITVRVVGPRNTTSYIQAVVY